MIRKHVIVFSGCFFFLFSSFLYSQNQQRRAPVVVSPVTKESVKKTVTLTGTVFPRTKSVVAAEVEGLVEEIVVEEGDFVEKGDKIAELGSSLYRLQLREAEAARKETEQRYFQARADLKRSEELVAKGFVAEKQLMDDRFNTEALEKNLSQHEAEVARLKDLLSKTRIFAPFSGAVAKKHTEMGEWVDKGGPLVTLIDLSRVHVTVLVPERYVTKVKVGEPAVVTADALGDQSFTGRVHAIISEGDPRARAFPVKFEVINEGFMLKSGMLARVTFATGYARKALMVPKDALVNRGEEYVVFTVDGTTAREVKLRVEDYHGDKAEVSGGKLEAGDRVVVLGNERLRDGQAVEIVSAEEGI